MEIKRSLTEDEIKEFMNRIENGTIDSVRKKIADTLRSIQPGIDADMAWRVIAMSGLMGWGMFNADIGFAAFDMCTGEKTLEDAINWLDAKHKEV